MQTAPRLGGAEIRRVGDVDVANHGIVNVATEHYQPGPVEGDRGVNLAFVQGQVKVLGLRERIDLVAHRIAVRELDAGARGDNKNAGQECQILLIHHGRP